MHAQVVDRRHELANHADTLIAPVEMDVVLFTFLSEGALLEVCCSEWDWVT